MASTVTMMKTEMLTIPELLDVVANGAGVAIMVSRPSPAPPGPRAFLIQLWFPRAAVSRGSPMAQTSCLGEHFVSMVVQTLQPPRVARPWLVCGLPSPARRLGWPSPASGTTQPGVGRLPSGSLGAWSGLARPGPAWLGTTTVNTRSTHGQHDGQHTVNTTVNIP